MMSPGIGSAGDNEEVVPKDDPKQGRIAWHGGPLPEYRALVITEAGALWRASSGMLYHRGMFTVELGTLVNIDRHTALGGTFYFGFRERDGHLFGLKARYRRWFRGVGLDVAPGVLLSGQNVDGAAWPGFTGHIGCSLRDWIVLTAQVDVVRHSATEPLNPARVEKNVYLGVKFGSYLGLLAPLVAAIIAAIAFAASGGFNGVGF